MRISPKRFPTYPRVRVRESLDATAAAVLTLPLHTERINADEPEWLSASRWISRRYLHFAALLLQHSKSHPHSLSLS